MATNHNVNINVKARGADQAKRQIGGVSSSMKNLAKNAVIAGGAFFGAQALIGGLKKSVQLAGEQEAAEKKLSVAYGGNIDALKKYAAQLQQVTAYGDEVTIGAMSRIAAFVKDENQLKAATKAAQDMAAAQGMDLVQAADLVAKTLGSSMNALSRYGVQVEGAVGSTERLTAVTEGITNLWGGQAEAAAETMTGQLQQMENAIGDAQEAIGAGLSPVISDLAKEVKYAAEWWIEFADAESEARQEADELGKSLFKMSGPVGWIALALWGEDGPENTIDPLQDLRDAATGAMTSAGLFADTVAMIEETDPTALTEMSVAMRAAGNMDAANAVSALALAIREANDAAGFVGPIKPEAIKELGDAPARASMIWSDEEAEAETLAALAHEEKMARYDEVFIAIQEQLTVGEDALNAELAGFAKLEEAARAKFEAGQLRMKQERKMQKEKLAWQASAVLEAMGFAKAAAAVDAAMATKDAFAGAQSTWKYWSAAFPPVAPAAYALALGAGLAQAAQVAKAGNFAEGGYVGGSGAGDSVRANLTAGEYVMTRSAVDALGVETLDELNAGGGGGVTLNIAGNILGTEEFVRDTLLPEIEKTLAGGLA